MCVCASFPFGFAGGMWSLLVSVPDHFLSVNFIYIYKSSSGASVKLKRQTNCKSANVIYLITCTQCGKQYVGETKRALNERMNGHRSDWTKQRFQRSPVAEHFHLQNHDFNSHVSLCCIEHDVQWSDDTRKARESYWIRRLNTIQPHGINKGD